MRDQDVRQVFQTIVGEPTPEFTAALRKQLLNLADPGGTPITTRGPQTPAKKATITMVELNPKASSGRRWGLPALGAVAAAIVIVIAVFAVSRDSDDQVTSVTEPTLTPTTPASDVPQTTTAPASNPPSTVAPTTSPTPATTAAPRGPRTTLPSQLDTGRFELASAEVPLEFTTTQPWSRILDFPDRVLLGRGQDLVDGELVIAFDRFDDAESATILDGLCVDKAVFGTPTSTSMMGVQATRIDGTTSDACSALAIGGSGFFIDADRTFVIVAAEVNDHVVVVFASAPSANSVPFLVEIDELVATMQTLN